MTDPILSPTSQFYYNRYSVVRNPLVTYNYYMNTYTRKTYEPLYVYYKPAGLKYTVGYYSPIYLDTYYDGYGYNFYYGNYGYYEYSLNPDEPNTGSWVVISITLVLGIACCFIFCFFCQRHR